MDKGDALVVIVIFLGVLALGFQQSVFMNNFPAKDLIIRDYHPSFAEGITLNENYVYANVKYNVPSPCHTVKYSVLKLRNDITFLLDLYQTNDKCIQVISEQDALLVYGPLELGGYNIKVIINNNGVQEILYEKKAFSL